MKNPPCLFIDTETLGLDLGAPIWEVAAVRVDEYGNVEQTFQVFVKHDQEASLDYYYTLPTSFQKDYQSRYAPDEAWDPVKVMEWISSMARGKALVCGSNPSFDMQRIEQLAISLELPTPPYHYHPEDVPTLARGWLNGKGVYPAPPWKSDLISQMCGVDPKEFDRHSAMGDVQWCLALWNKVHEK